MAKLTSLAICLSDQFPETRTYVNCEGLNTFMFAIKQWNYGFVDYILNLKRSDLQRVLSSNLIQSPLHVAVYYR